MTRLFEPEATEEPTDPPVRHRRRRGDSNFLGVKWNVVGQVLGWILGAFITYNAVTQRITALEIRQTVMSEEAKEQRDSLKSELTEMRADIKTLLQRR